MAYEKELENEKKRLEKMKEEGRDVHDTNKQVGCYRMTVPSLFSNVFTFLFVATQQEVINETIMLLPDCQRRITAAYDDLQKLVKSMVGKLAIIF